MPAEQKSELAFLPLQADRSERPGVPGLTDGTGEKLHEASGKTFSVKNVVLIDEKREGADW